MLNYKPEYFVALHWGRKWGPMTFETDDIGPTCIGSIYNLPNLSEVPLGWYYTRSIAFVDDYYCSDKLFCIRFIASSWDVGPICRKT